MKHEVIIALPDDPLISNFQAVPVRIPSGQAVEWEIELVEFDKAPNWHPMSASERIPVRCGTQEPVFCPLRPS
jgi:hypothetical protein